MVPLGCSTERMLINLARSSKAVDALIGQTNGVALRNGYRLAIRRFLHSNRLICCGQLINVAGHILHLIVYIGYATTSTR